MFFDSFVQVPFGLAYVALFAVATTDFVNHPGFVQFICFILWADELTSDGVGWLGVDTDAQLPDLATESFSDTLDVGHGDVPFGWSLSLGGGMGCRLLAA